jgi:ubiquinone/menaquinone biosynthesis C-methylase UbiE
VRVLLRDDLVAALASLFMSQRRITPSRPVAAASALAELASLGLVTPDRKHVTNDQLAYACFEHYRQTHAPDRFEELLLTYTPGSPRVLDLCCGPGATVRVAAGKGPEVIYAFDNNPHFVGMVRELAEYLPKSTTVVAGEADAHELPLSDGAVDLIICRAALQYLRVKAVLAEMRRVLAPGGRILVLVHGPGYPLAYWHSRKLKAAVRLFVNGWSYNLLGQGLFPGEIFLTPSSLTQSLSDSGFAGIRLEEAPEWRRLGISAYIAVTAIKRRP